jgi:hypothetical protein
MKPPVRMLDDAALTPGLRHDLEQTHALPEPYDVTAGERRLAAALSLADPTALAEDVANASAEVGTAGQLAATPGSGVLGSGALKLGMAVAAAAAITAGVLAWPETAPRTPPRAAAANAPSARAPSPVPSQPLQASHAPRAPHVVQAPRAPDLSQAPPAQAATPRRPLPDADAALRREIAQIGRIKQLLARDAMQAYRVAEAGHREFPLGMLREEREALAVLALWRAAREPQAARRSRAFLGQYPQSAHREEIERRLRLAQERDAPRVP